MRFLKNWWWLTFFGPPCIYIHVLLCVFSKDQSINLYYYCSTARCQSPGLCLAGVYLELVDDSGHRYGPGSSEVTEAIKQVDFELAQLLDALDATTNINLMVFSDHGMAQRLGGADNATLALINVLDYIDRSDWQHAAGSKAGPNLQIWPKSDNEDWASLIMLTKYLLTPV